MRILFVTDTYFPHVNGVCYFIQRLASGLQLKSHEVAIVAPSETIHFSQKEVDGVRVYGIPSLSILLYRTIRFPIPFLLTPHLDRILLSFKPDVIHVQSHFALSKALIKVNSNYHIPVIATNHFMTENLTVFLKEGKWVARVENWMWSGFAKVFNEASIVTTPTAFAVSLIRPKLKVDVVAVSNGIDLERFNPRKGLKSVREKYGIPEKPVLLYVGRLDPEKHIDEILAAVALTLKRADFCFVIAGKGVKKAALQRLALQLGIADQVIFTGFVSDEDLPLLYETARCFVTASIAELQSIATMEAMASGLPIIAADAGALSELVHHGSNGYLFNPGDINALAHSIQALLSDEQAHEKMRKMSLQHIAKHDINTTIEVYESLYEQLMGGAKESRRAMAMV